MCKDLVLLQGERRKGARRARVLCQLLLCHIHHSTVRFHFYSYPTRQILYVIVYMCRNFKYVKKCAKSFHWITPSHLLASCCPFSISLRNLDVGLQVKSASAILLVYYVSSILPFSFHSVLFRLYWFPTKVLYSTIHVSVVVYPGGPFYLPFNLMLLALFGMQVCGKYSRAIALSPDPNPQEGGGLGTRLK